MLSFEEMLENNEELAKIAVELEHVPLTKIMSPDFFLSDIFEYLQLEGFEPDGDLKFLRTARVVETIYYIWSFESQKSSCYATVSIGPQNQQCVGGDENYWNLSPEQFIMADYHNCM